MSSALQSSANELISIQWNNCTCLTMLTIAGYDYILVFPKEIEYIWGKRWSRVSTLFILVRYFGLLNLVCISLSHLYLALNRCVYSALIPLTLVINKRLINSCGMIYIIMQWSNILFLATADLVMILRVWAMYNRSWPILWILLVLFLIGAVFAITFLAFDSDPKDSLWITSQTLEYSYCAVAGVDSDEIVLEQMASSAQIIFGITLCMLTIIQFIRQSLEMYRTTGQRQINQYVNLLVKEGIAYFLVLLLRNGIALWDMGGKPSTDWRSWLLNCMSFVPPWTLIPRFIISIRELYEHDVQGRQGGGIDTGFGLSIPSDRGTTTGSRIMFASRIENEVADNTEADVRQVEGFEDIREVQRRTA